MPTVVSPRRVLAFTMGIAAVFDLTGTTVYRTMRGVLPPAPPAAEDSSDPFQAAMTTILSAHRDAIAGARDESGMALPHERASRGGAGPQPSRVS
jgi:hypothetical protein